MATVKSLTADISSVGPSPEPFISPLLQKVVNFLISIIFIYLIVLRLTQDLRTFSVNNHYLKSGFETGSIQLLFLFFFNLRFTPATVVTGAHGPKVLTIFASRPLNYEKRKIVLNM